MAVSTLVRNWGTPCSGAAWLGVWVLSTWPPSVQLARTTYSAYTAEPSTLQLLKGLFFSLGTQAGEAALLHLGLGCPASLCPQGPTTAMWHQQEILPCMSHRKCYWLCCGSACGTVCFPFVRILAQALWQLCNRTMENREGDIPGAPVFGAYTEYALEIECLLYQKNWEN